MATKATLFSEDSDIENNVPSANGDEICINKNYANYYESFRKKEELQRLKDTQSHLKSYDSNSGDSSDDEMVKPTIQSLNYLANTLLALKDDKANKKLFNNALHSKNEPDDETACENGHSKPTHENEKKKKKRKKETVYTLDTHRRETNWNTEEGGDVSDDEKEPSFPERRGGPRVSLQHCSMDDLLSDKACNDEVTAGGDRCSNGSTDDSKKYPQKNFQSASHSSTNDVAALLKQAFLKPNMTPDQEWLANFVIRENQQMLEGSDSDEEQHLSGSSRRHHQNNKQRGDMHGFVYEDEAEETRRTMRETLASFGGNGPTLDQQRPKSYPAVLESTVRIKDDKRRQSRLKDAERKAAEKQRLRQQVQQLQAIKRKEIQEKLKKIQDISGQTRLAFNEEDLDDEFDPEAHDRKMQEAFGENYYDDGHEGKKPVFEYDEGIDADMGDYDGYEVHAADDKAVEDEAVAPSSSKHANLDLDEADYPEEHDAEASLHAQGGEEEGSSRRRRGKRRKNDLLSQALQRKKPLFDPEQHDFDKYFDEYYALNFEDVIAGGEVKCRFKYKQVEPNNFGLSTEEILLADDKELNRWCGLKKLLNIDRTAEKEERDRKVFRAKGQNLAYKKKMLPTLFKPPEEEIDTETVIDVAAAQRAEEDKKKKKNLKKKLRKQRKLEEEEKKQVEENNDGDSDDSDLDTGSKKTGSSENDKRKREAVDSDEEESIDDPEEKKEPEAKKPKHSSTTVLKAKKSKEDELHKFNKKMKKRRCEEEAKLLSEGAASKQKASQRKSRKELVVGDAFSTVLKLSDERLAAYNITGLSKIKSQARYHEKMAERGLEPRHRGGKGGKEKGGKRDKPFGKHKKDKSKKHKTVENNKDASKSKSKKKR